MNILAKACFSLAVLLLLPLEAHAEAIDPELYIKKKGATASTLSEDGKIRLISRTEKITIENFRSLENSLEPIEKDPSVLDICDRFRGMAKASLIENSGAAVDAVVTKYGWSGKTVVCGMKFMNGNRVLDQITLIKSLNGEMYVLAVTGPF